MKHINKILGIFLFICILKPYANSQFGYGLTGTYELYARHANPTDNIAARSAGSSLFNFGLGPKLWLGGRGISVSVESQFIIAPLGFSVVDYKGLGIATIPTMIKLNFKGLTGLDREGKMGWHLGAGIQYHRTELFGISNKFEARGVQRKWTETVIGQLGYGFGISGFGGCLYLRYGQGRMLDANTFSMGLQVDFNLPMLKKITSPDSEL